MITDPLPSVPSLSRSSTYCSRFYPFTHICLCLYHPLFCFSTFYPFTHIYLTVPLSPTLFRFLISISLHTSISIFALLSSVFSSFPPCLFYPLIPLPCLSFSQTFAPFPFLFFFFFHHIHVLVLLKVIYNPFLYSQFLVVLHRLFCSFCSPSLSPVHIFHTRFTLFVRVCSEDKKHFHSRQTGLQQEHTLMKFIRPMKE